MVNCMGVLLNTQEEYHIFRAPGSHYLLFLALDICKIAKEPSERHWGLQDQVWS